MLFQKTSDELISQAINNLKANTSVTRTSAGAKARALTEVVMDELANSYNFLNFNILFSFVGTSTGIYLDFIGELVGLTRKTPASVQASMPGLVKFKVDSGTFGDINSGNPITLDRRDVILSTSGRNPKKFFLTSNFTLPSDQSEYSVSIESASTGKNQEIDTDTLQNISGVTYSDSANSTLKIINAAPLVGGRNRESDNEFRLRIVNAVNTAEAANNTAIRFSALSIPGVDDVILDKHDQGIGTFTLYIKTLTPTVPSNIINAVKNIISQVTSVGSYYRVVSPNEIGIQLRTNISYYENLSSQEKIEIERATRNRIIDYINSLDISQELVLSEIIQTILDGDDRIKRVGEYTKPFQELFVWKTSIFDKSKRTRYELTSDYQTKRFERVIVEPSISNPISIIGI